MNNQQYNLYNQPPQSSQPSEQPTPSNKLWPINWGHNRFYKILGISPIIYSLTCFGIVITVILIFIADLRLILGNNKVHALVEIIVYALKFYPLFILVSLLNILLFFVIKKTTDKMDKILFYFNIFNIPLVLIVKALLTPVCC